MNAALLLLRLAVEGGLLAQRGHLVNWLPVAFGLGIAGYFHLPSEPAWGLIGGAVLAVPSGLWAAGRIGPAFAPLATAVALIALGGLTATLRANLVAAPVLDWRYYGPVQGRVIEIDRAASDNLRLTLDHVVLARMDPAATPARVRVTLSGGAGFAQTPQDILPVMPATGDVVILTAHLAPPNGPVEPGDFDFRLQAWFEGLGAVGYSRTPVLRVARAEGAGTLWVARTRYFLSRALQSVVPGDPGGLAAAVMTGDRAGLSQAASDAMRDANLYHLVSISGMHMGMLVAIVFAAVRGGLALIPWVALHWPLKKIAAAAALPVALFYLLLAGRDVATERAFVMSAVMLGAVLIDRQAISLRVVALGAFGVLVLRPESLLGAGFQMSFAAVVAMVAIFRAVQVRVAERALWRWSLPPLMLLLSSLIAGLATAPYAAAHFNRVAHYGLIANLLAVPVMGFVVMPAALILGLTGPLGLIEPARTAVEWGNAWILWISAVIADWNGAVSLLPRPPAAVLPLVTAAGLVLCLWQGRGRWAGLPLALLAVALWSVAPRPDLLISQSGGLVGIMGAGGRAFSRPEGETFAAENWRANDGSTLPQAAALPAMTVTGRSARGELGGIRVLALRGAGALAAITGCGGADILVSSVAVEGSRPCLVLDPPQLARSGAVAGRVTRDGVALWTQADLAGQRLWTGRPARDALPFVVTRADRPDGVMLSATDGEGPIGSPAASLSSGG